MNFSEYSVLFADTKLHKNDLTEEHLIDYPFFYLGNEGKKRHYSLNSIFSKYPIIKSETIDFVCNENADMEKKNGVVAPDYYYIQSDIVFDGKIIRFISTHFAFGKTSDLIALNQAKELIEEYRDDEYVVICGDFNMIHPESYEVFCEAGYKLANHGEFGDFGTDRVYNLKLDNIIVKGLEIVDVRMLKTDLSDHFPIICDICFEE